MHGLNNPFLAPGADDVQRRFGLRPGGVGPQGIQFPKTNPQIPVPLGEGSVFSLLVNWGCRFNSLKDQSQKALEWS